MQAKAWFFEAAMNTGDLDYAVSGLQGIRKKTSTRTRIHLEATALLAICHLRRRRVELAEPLIAECLRNESVIRSEPRRRQFRLRLIQRFEEEGALAAFDGVRTEIPDGELDDIQSRAGMLVQSSNEDEIFAEIGTAAPPQVIATILRIDTFARKQLPIADLRYLPVPADILKPSKVGRTVFSSAKRVLWRALCEPTSEIYKAWFTNGLGVVLSKKYLVAAVAAAVVDLGLGAKAFVAPMLALVIKFGIETYCEMYKPLGVMIGLDDRQ